MGLDSLSESMATNNTKLSAIRDNISNYTAVFLACKSAALKKQLQTAGKGLSFEIHPKSEDAAFPPRPPRTLDV